MRLGLQLGLLALLLGLCASCRGGRSRDAGEAGEEAAPKPIIVSADRKDLIFSYADPVSGEFKTATTAASVPEGARRQVIVTDLSLSPAERHSDRTIYLADLSSPRADGTFPVALASRYGFEAKLSGTSTAAPGPGDPAIARSERGVVLYTTSWCGVCKRTKALLKSLNVPYVEKDIEASRTAAEELERKAVASHIKPGGVPVIDVGGILLQGLDEPTLRSALKQKGLL